jgi:glycylpeptide N-tetradecanoyltransferase
MMRLTYEALCAVAGNNPPLPVATKAPLQQLMQDAMILATAKGYDVFNALDLMENASFLKDLKFGIGDGTLQYYLYNWRMAGTPIAPGETGLILL